MRTALKEAAVHNPLYVASDGQKAIDYFCGTGEYTDRKAFPLPVLVLLDLKLPLKKGLDVLQWLRSQAELRKLVVVILTSSREPSDLHDAYRLGANSFLVKPGTRQRLTELAKAVKTYWLEFNLFDSSSAGDAN
jgi:CheY-like chemotaxis protein